MKPLIIANWKMNPAGHKEAKELFAAIKRGVAKFDHANVVICPPFVYLPLLEGMSLGAQNIFYKEKGAFTGEISPMMLKDLGVEYALIGHSECRKYFGETNEDTNKKIKAASEFGIKSVLCVGEQDGEAKQQVLTTQITDALKGVTGAEMKHVAIAYEPVWAIGTGKNCSVDETQKSLILIRKLIADLYNREVADTTRILYGGSVKSDNAAPYIKEAGANGLLVGGASLVAEEFAAIVKAAE